MVPHGNVRKERHRQGEGAIRQGVRLTQSGRAQRILPPVHVDDGTAALLDQVLQHDGEALNIFGALANHPAVLRRYSALGGSLLQKGSLPARSRELMILRVAYRSSCDYEFAHHSVIAAAAGLTEAEVKAL